MSRKKPPDKFIDLSRHKTAYTTVKTSLKSIIRDANICKKINEIVIKIIPMAMETLYCPILLFMAIKVVMTRVNPRMLPPTIITAPTSEIARPKPVTRAIIITDFSSKISKIRIFHFWAPRVLPVWTTS